MTPVETIDVTEQVTLNAMTWPEKAKALVINDAESYTFGAELLLGIKSLRKEVDATFDPLTQSAFENHRKIVAAKRKAETPLSEAEQTIKGAMVAFDREQQRLARIEEERQREIARREEEDRRLAEAALLEAEGTQFGDAAMVAQAQQIVEEAIQRPAPVAIAPVLKATPKVSGISMKKSWAFRVTRPELVPRQYCEVSEAKIRGVVKSLGPAANIPGVEVYEEQTIAAGRR